MAHAPKQDDGSCLYVVTTTSWGREWRSLVSAKSLKEAKAEHGWSRARYESKRVHRATVEEVAALGWHLDPASVSEETEVTK